jgi:CARDB
MTEKYFHFLILGAFLTGMALTAPVSATEFSVDLKTNFRPGVDFIAVRTTIFERSGSGLGRLVDKREISAFTTSDVTNGVRIAEFDIPNGDYISRVELLNQNETAIEQRDRQFTLTADLGAVEVISVGALPATCSANLAATESKLSTCNKELETAQNNVAAAGLPAGCLGTVTACPPKCPQQATCPPKCPQQAACPPKCPQQAACESSPGTQDPAGPPKPDLVPSNPQPGTEKFGFCRFDASGKNLIVTVKNQGVAAAEPSLTEVKFKDEAPATQSTPAIPAGGSIDVLFERPPSCKIPGCQFEITVDSARSVDEADETNNVATGLCLG